jgi:predicted Na+-dependent transporter
MSLNSALAWLGRQGTKAVAASLAVGIAIPPLAAALKPIFTAAIFLLLVFAFLRVDPADLRARFASPAKVSITSLWIMVASPVLCGLALSFIGLDRIGPGIALGLIMYMAAPPVMASTAFAAFLRLDTAISLAVLIVCTAATPLLSPLIISFFAGSALNLDVAQLVWRLIAILGGAFVTAQILRWFFGSEKISANSGTIDGISVVLLILFGVTAMDGVTVRAIRDPLLIAGLTLLVFALAIGLYVLTSLLFWREGPKTSLALGFSAAHRNMGALMAAGGSALPELTWIYFGVAQFPIYFLPLLIAPFVHRLVERRLPGG